MKRRNPLVKILIALGVLAVLGFLFMRSLRDTRAQPYKVQHEQLAGWTLALEPATGPTAPALVLRPPADLMRGMMNQLFTRAMESFSSPAVSGIPLVLHGELAGLPPARATPEALVAAAHGAGLDAITLRPRCLAYRRMSTPQMTRQVYFMLFDLPAFTRFRQEMGLDPAALSPALIVAGSDGDSNSWLPLRADPATDCVAPIAAGSG